MYNNDVINTIERNFLTNKNSHAYIFYTNNFVLCQKDIYELVKKIFNVENINSISSDFIVVPKTEKKNILKEDIVELRDFFQKTSYLNNKRLYMIEEVHKLNSTSANMILKFLEEPLEGVLAFFITTNLDCVLPTIKSRCQIVNCFYDNDLEIENECKDILDSVFYNNAYINLFRLKKIFEKNDRNNLINIFNEYLNYCYINFDIENKKKVLVINNAINMLNSNVNIDYVFDYICIKGGNNK